ncbi:MAG: LysM peptidoglycan-binding domain-containing protein [Chloroflexi bacterium]|jgi:uncharacterized protein YkwD|nr:LysM peptidoglycan-binding domain-containing protein [Chloroflexota bacterium]
MIRKCFWGILFVFIFLLLGVPAKTIPATAQSDPGTEILRLVNQVRTGYGLAPFTWDATLAAAAQNQASYMAANNIYSHTGAGGSSPQSRANAAGYPGYATENIVGGTDLTPSQGIVWWQNSHTHFNTMISQRYIHAGVGFAQGHDQNFYALVVGAPPDQENAGFVTQPSLPGDEILAPVAPIQLAQASEDGSIIHTVGQGHSFWAIAARYEIPLGQLYLYNNLTAESVINPGDKLIIRLAEGQLPPPTPTPPASYIVGQGDSLWTIAAWYKLSLEELLWLNAMQEDSLLSPGDEVRIRLLPGEEPPPTSTPQTNHNIREGDTAWGIALEYGLSVDQLLAFNDMTANSVLTIGENLLIVPPSPTPTVTPPASATLPPTATAVATNTLPPTDQPTAQAVSLVVQTPTSAPTPEAEPTRVQPGLSTIIAIIGAGLLAFGAIAILLVRQQR